MASEHPGVALPSRAQHYSTLTKGSRVIEDRFQSNQAVGQMT
jgi:hypothetical protein